MYIYITNYYNDILYEAVTYFQLKKYLATNNIVCKLRQFNWVGKIYERVDA